MNSETNDTLLESPKIELFELENKLGLVSSWGSPHSSKHHFYYHLSRAPVDISSSNFIYHYSWILLK